MSKGEGEAEERVASPETGVLLLINQKLKQLLELQKQQIPEGIVENFEETVTAITLVDLVNDRPYRPLFQIDVFNDGPNEAFIKVNDQSEKRLKSGRNLIIDLKRPKIEKVQLRVDSGRSANIEIVGIY